MFFFILAWGWEQVNKVSPTLSQIRVLGLERSDPFLETVFDIVKIEVPEYEIKEPPYPVRTEWLQELKGRR